MTLKQGNQVIDRSSFGDPLLTLRAFACAIVVIGHGAGTSFPPTDIVRQTTDNAFFWLLLPLPWSGVWIFFTLSGYLMGKGFFTGRYRFSKQGILAFYRNRILRIAPLAYFAIFTLALLVRPDAFDLRNLKHLVALLMFDYDGTSPLSLIGLLWSIATEMQFYALAPFLAFAIVSTTRKATPISILLVFLVIGLTYRLAACYYSASANWTLAVYTPLLGNLDMFGVGMTSALIVQRTTFRWARLSHGLALIFFIYIAAAWICAAMVINGRWVAWIQYLAPTIFCIATSGTIIILENSIRFDAPHPVLAKVVSGTKILGSITFAVYLWHAPIFQAYAKTLKAPILTTDTFKAILLSGSLAAIFSWITYRLVEKPFDDMRRSPSDKDRRSA